MESRMWPGGGMKTSHCPCCKVCPNCPGFQKVLDKSEAGFILYRHVTRVEDINKKTGVIETTTNTIDDVFIIENTQGIGLENIDFTPEIDRNQISCPRCANILKHAQRLLKNQDIGKNDVTGVCEHCRQKAGRTCVKCDKIVEKFQLSKDVGKQSQAQRVKTWLSKIHELIKPTVVEVKGKESTSQIKRRHSDIDISNLFPKKIKNDREPEIEDLFLDNIRYLHPGKKGSLSDRSYLHEASKEKEVAFNEPLTQYEEGQYGTVPIYSTPQEDGDDFIPVYERRYENNILLHAPSGTTVTDARVKDFFAKPESRYKDERPKDALSGKKYEQSRDYLSPAEITRYDKGHVPYTDSRHESVRRKDLGPSESKYYDGDRKKEHVPYTDSRHEGVRRKDLGPSESKYYEGDRKKEHVPYTDSRHKGVRRKDLGPSESKYEDDRKKEHVPYTDSRHETVRKKDLGPSESKYETDRKKERVPYTDSRHESVKRKDLGPSESKYYEGDRKKDRIPYTDSRHESVRKKDLGPSESKYETDRKKERVPYTDSRHESVRRKDLGPSESKYEADKKKERVPYTDSRHENLRKKEYAPDSDLRHEGGKKKEPHDKNFERDRKKDYIPVSDSYHEGGRKRTHSPPYTSGKPDVGDRKKDYISEADVRYEGGRRKEYMSDSDSRHDARKRRDYLSKDSKHYGAENSMQFFKSPHDDRKRELMKKAGIRRADEPLGTKHSKEEKRGEFKVESEQGKVTEGYISAMGKGLAHGAKPGTKTPHESVKKKEFASVSDTHLEDVSQMELGARKDPKKLEEHFVPAAVRRYTQDISALFHPKVKTDEKKVKRTATKILFESPSRIRKHHSEESLLAGIRKMKSEMQKQRHKSFDLYFPEGIEERKKRKARAESAVSSSELIKDTMVKLKSKIEKEKMQREEADRLKEETRKQHEKEKQEKIKLLTAKIAKESEKEKEAEREKDFESEKQDVSQKGQDTSKKQKDASKKDQEASKIEKDQDAYKRQKDSTKKEQDVSKKQDAPKKQFEDETVKEKALKGKLKQDSQEPRKKEKETDLANYDEKRMETKSKKEDQVGQSRAEAKIKSKEENLKDGTTKEKSVKETKTEQVKTTENKDKDAATGKRDHELENLQKKLDQDAKEREKLLNDLKKQKEEERQLKLAADQKLAEAAKQKVDKKEPKLGKKSEKTRTNEDTSEKKPEKVARPKSPPIEVPFDKIRMKKPSIYDLIVPKQRPKERRDLPSPIEIHEHKSHGDMKDDSCKICNDSDLELDLQSLLRKKQMELDMKNVFNEVIIGEKLHKFKSHIAEAPIKEGIQPELFRTHFDDFEQVEVDLSELELEPEPEIKPKPTPVVKGFDQDFGKGVVRYSLSDRTFIEKGWTMLPTEKVVRKMNVYRMRPAHPEFDWFEHNKKKGMLEYDTGERLAEFDEDGRGRWYYRNGKLALDYYNAEELNAQQRFVIYSSGEPDERGRTHPRTVLATFDYLGNGVVFDHAGKIRLKYNQTEGVVLDRSLGPVSHWKWHTLNDPPVLQQVMIDTQMAHKDPQILKLGGPAENKPRPDDEEMLAIEFDNFIKDKSAKLSQSFKPFQIKMKALKINENFSLRVLDQATVYLLYRDGTTNIKLNIGMLLDHKEIVDTDTAEVGEVSVNAERLPARTDSLAELQRNVADAQRVDRCRSERERRLRRPEPMSSADRLTAAASRPMKLPLRTVDSTSTVGASKLYCKCRKPASCNVYYDTSLI